MSIDLFQIREWVATQVISFPSVMCFNAATQMSSLILLRVAHTLGLNTI